MNTRTLISTLAALLLASPAMAQALKAIKNQAATPAAPAQIKLQFPAGAAVGSLDSGVRTEVLPFWHRDHKMVPTKAQGEVKLPKGTCLQLDVEWEGAKEMSWLGKLGPDASAVVVLDLKKLPIGESQMADLGKYCKADHLYLDDTEVNDKQLHHLAAIKNLIALRLCKTAVNGEGFAALAPCKYLAALDMANNALKGENLGALTKLPALISLRLENCAVKDSDLAALSAMPVLRNLSLRANRNVTDRGLEHLVKIKTLASIDLSGTSIDAQAAKVLKKLPQLRSITVSHKYFIKSSVAEFHLILPDCKVKFARGRDDILMEIFQPLH